jgi:hypothetical protein
MIIWYIFLGEILGMACNCNGVCTRYRAKRLDNGGRYSKGQKRCQRCEIFIKWEGLWCPCCNYRLRTKPRNSKYKIKFQEEIILNGM